MISSLGSIIRGKRMDQGLTQAQLAMASGVGIRFIHDLEMGKGTCHVSKALEVISMLGLTVQIGDKKL